MANEYGAQEQKKFDWYQTMTNTVIEHLESGADFFDTLDMVSIPIQKRRLIPLFISQVHTLHNIAGMKYIFKMAFPFPLIILHLIDSNNRNRFSAIRNRIAMLLKLLIGEKTRIIAFLLLLLHHEQQIAVEVISLTGITI